MAKSRKQLSLKELQKKAISILKKKTGSKNVILNVVKIRVFPDGTIVYVFSTLPNSEFPSGLVYLSKNGDQVDIQTIEEQQTESTPIPNAPNSNDLITQLNETQGNTCIVLPNIVNHHLAGINASKHNQLENCEEHSDNCKCDDVQNSPFLDLVIIADYSGSMTSKVSAISDAINEAVCRLKCPTDAEITLLGVGQSIPAHGFYQSVRDYLIGIGCQSDDLVADAGHQEEGADSITDLSHCFNWRENACRAIFYASDEPLDRGATQSPQDTAATLLAIDTANSNNVTVSLHLVEGSFDNNPDTYSNYENLSLQTGGIFIHGGQGDKEQYVDAFNQIICNACGCCKKAPLSEFEPCIKVAWGDSDCDCFETDDFEEFTVTICNQYSNISFTNFEIGVLYIVDENGQAVPLLPDGSPSVEIFPLGPICFGDIGPCQGNSPNCVSRQFVIRTRGAKSGKYKLKMGGISYQICYDQCTETCFELNLCKDE